MNRYQLGLIFVIIAPGVMLQESPAQQPTKDKTAAAKGKGTALTPREFVLPDRGGKHGMGVAFTGDSSKFAWWDGKGIALWDLAQAKMVGTIQPAGWMFVMSQDGKVVATDMTAEAPPVIKIYDVATGKEMHQLARPAGDGPKKESLFHTCSFDRTGAKLFTRTDVDLQVWDVKTGKMLRRIATAQPVLNNKSHQSPDGRYFTFDNGVGSTNVFETQTETSVSIPTPNKTDLGVILGRPQGGFISSVGSWSFSADGRIVFGTDQLNGVLLAWSLPQGKMINGVKVQNLTFAKVSADTSRILASYRADKGAEQKTLWIMRVLDGKNQQVLATLGPMKAHPSSYALSPDGRWAFVSSLNDTRLWDLAAKSE
jgi:WD40 repeat protein